MEHCDSQNKSLKFVSFFTKIIKYLLKKNKSKLREKKINVIKESNFFYRSISQFIGNYWGFFAKE